ncbi:MAG: subclass B3 metallo-beta-lactamase [Pseudomonadota bacterium]
MRKVLLALIVVLAFGCEKSTTDAKRAAIRVMFPSWYQNTAPFRMIGNIYWVGPKGLGAFLIPTDDGHILIDGGVPENAPMISENIRALGFDIEDIRILLNTHAHFDHAGGLAALKDETKARMLATEGDRSALEGGFYLGFENRHELDFPPVAVDQVIQDGDTVSLGNVSLTAHLTPGHTRGCTSWTMTVDEGGETYEVLIFCSASVAANRLAGPPQYDGIVDDYRSTFAKTKDWRPDVFLSNHAEFFDMEEKRARLEDGDALAFVAEDEFPKFIARAEAAFKIALGRQEE